MRAVERRRTRLCRKGLLSLENMPTRVRRTDQLTILRAYSGNGDHFALFNQSITSVEFPTWLRPRQPSEDRIAIASAKGERPVSADLSLAALHPPRSR